MSSFPKSIVVVGTSSGGIRALEELVIQLKPEMDAAFFFVLHLSRKGVGDVLYQRLFKQSKLPCKVAESGMAIEKGVVYVAPADQHMLLTEEHVVVGRGAPENRWRPSINNLFRSAAAAFNSRVVGIILTGLMDDGASGMASIKRSGGITIVQDPNEADHPDMPLSVLENIEVDFTESLSKMGFLLAEILNKPMPHPVEVPYDVAAEAQMDLRVSTRIDNVAQFEKATVNCPDCGGGLYITQKEHPTHYRCHVGHSYTERELLIRVSEVIENTFWTSLRMMEERRAILLRLATKDEERGYKTSARMHREKAQDMEVHIENLKQILFTSVQVD